MRKNPFFIALPISVLIANLMLYLGFQHNAQGEFYTAEMGYDWAYILQFLAINTVIGFVVLSVILGVFSIVRKFIGNYE